VYTKIFEMAPYDKIPPAGAASVAAAQKRYAELRAASPKLVADFEAKWASWLRKWATLHTSNAAESMSTTEFEALVGLGPQIGPLVVHRLSIEPGSFIGTFLYNALETDRDFKVHPDDILNYSVLQRQARLIVDLNSERACPATLPAARAGSQK
jgi:hypothetical protein